MYPSSKQSTLFPGVAGAMLLAVLLASTSALAATPQFEPVELLLDFQVTGNFTSGDATTFTYTIEGPGYAPISSLPAKSSTRPCLFAKQPSSAMPRSYSLTSTSTAHPASSNSPASSKPVARYCSWLPACPSPDTPLSCCGCLMETSGQGKYANMVGSICFNGALNFNVTNPMQLIGSSTGHRPNEPLMCLLEAIESLL